MDPVVFTPRLKLTLVTKIERGSPELEWMHELRSDEKASSWSIYGRSKTLEDTEKILKGHLPTTEGGEKAYRVAYAVHEMLEPMSGSEAEKDQKPTKFVGLVTLTSFPVGGLVLPEEFVLPVAAATTILTVELAYSFMPAAWGKGYATEALSALFEAGKRARAFWAPFEKVYVRVIVNGGNPASLRVMGKMEKHGMKKRGVYELDHKPFFLGGEWTEHSSLHIFGMHLIER
ncbi:uncharacterized protein BDZ99DRAFT_468352 [Mytilinidion resinicola]|uniref:N-acetyltransferase domain-containing protein n=1 Tax=Mytilinidion resinicola TaxID=574789 RepID=A0A6A6Y4F5_9PEZI|nr:uncharacterized protein BDZ99DRAFT_468352 [Mytilinidion resinicola]KAF2803403.1 hypothetical protein BDZ99DRAFT_468352 [Mytilinidion resinicola]